MKRIIFAIIIGLMMTASCYRNEIDNLQSQIDELRNTQIASVSQQIVAIQSTINDLLETNSELDGYIQELRNRDGELGRAISSAGSDIDNLEELLDDCRQESSDHMTELLSQLEELQSRFDSSQGTTSSELAEILKKIEEIEAEIDGAGHGSATEIANLAALIEELRSAMESERAGLRATIDSLEAENASLDYRINSLEKYVNDGLLEMDTSIENLTEWMEATFATVKQYDSTVSQIASIKASVEALNESMASMENRIKEEFSTEIEDAVSALGAEMEEMLSSTVSEIIDGYTSAIEDARNGIEAAYEASIARSISDLESSLKEWVNGQLSGYLSLSQAKEELDALKSELEQQIESSQTYLENMISEVQSSLSEAINNNKAMIEALKLQIGTGTAIEPELVEQILSNSEKIGENASAIAANSQLIDENARLVAANTAMIESNAVAIEELRSSISSEHQLILANAELIARNTEKIAANAELIAANAQQIEINSQQIAANAAEIEELWQALESTKSEITEKYQAAIASAMSGIDSRLDEFEASLSAIEYSVQSSLSDYEDRVSVMEAKFEEMMNDVQDIKDAIYDINVSLDGIKDQITSIMNRIQSISYVPKYEDGDAVMTYTNSGGVITPGTAVMDFEIRPTSIASEIAAVWQEAISVKAVYTLTRAVEFVELTVVAVEASPDGVLTVTFSGDGLDESFYRSETSVSAALVISDGNNELSSDYINIVPRTTDNIYIPDAGFKKYLVEEFDSDGDGEISFKEAETVEKIDVSASLDRIESLDGIEYFTNLKELDCSRNFIRSLDLRSNTKLLKVNAGNNYLTSLDVSGCTAITELNCEENDLTVLDVSMLPSLVTLDCSDNRIVSLNVSKNTAIQALDCSGNAIKILNIGNNRELVSLDCGDNYLTDLNLRYNMALTSLDCSSNSISLLDLSKNTELTELNCSGNALRSLLLLANPKLVTLDCSANSLYSVDVSACTLLETFNCSDNELTQIDVSKCASLMILNCSGNKLTSVNVSANSSLASLDCSANPDLATIWMSGESQEQSVELVTDSGEIFYNDGGLVIPDPALKNYLVTNYDYDGDGEISIAEAEAITQVNCRNLGITDLSGLEACPNLEYLDCSGNSISVMDLPHLTKLTSVICYDNVLTDINLIGCSALTSMRIINTNTNAINGTSMSIIGYEQSESLTLSMAQTPVVSMTVSGSPKLTKLDLTANTQLTFLDASGNSVLPGLDVSTLRLLTSLDVHGCDLQSFDVTNNAELVTLITNDNSIPSLDVTHNPHLVTLECSQNALTRIDVSKNPLLQRLDLSDNQLSTANVASNPVLTWLDVSNNAGTSFLNISNNPQITVLNASGLSLSELDINSNPELDSLTLDAADCYLVVSGYRAIENVNTFGKVCVFNDENRATWYLNWKSDWNYKWEEANEYCVERGMSLPTMIEADVIAQRILYIREVLDISCRYDYQDYWILDVNEDNSMQHYFMNFSEDFKYNVSIDRTSNGLYKYYFATFIKY